MLIPSQIILTHVRPSYWLPGLELTWGILTGLMATVKNAKQIYAIRTFIGLCESSAWPGMMTILSEYQPLFAALLNCLRRRPPKHAESSTFSALVYS